MDSNDHNLRGRAGMGKVGRSYSRFDEMEPFVERGDDRKSGPHSVIAGLIALFIGLGLIGLALTFWPG